MKTHYPFPPGVEVGDLLLTALASNPAVIYADEVIDVYEQDEMWIVRTEAGDYYRFHAEDVVTVLRPKGDE